jgi:hypothetical protein
VELTLVLCPLTSRHFLHVDCFRRQPLERISALCFSRGHPAVLQAKQERDLEYRAAYRTGDG